VESAATPRVAVGQEATNRKGTRNAAVGLNLTEKLKKKEVGKEKGGVARIKGRGCCFLSASGNLKEGKKKAIAGGTRPNPSFKKGVVTLDALRGGVTLVGAHKHTCENTKKATTNFLGKEKAQLSIGSGKNQAAPDLRIANLGGKGGVSRPRTRGQGIEQSLKGAKSLKPPGKNIRRGRRGSSRDGKDSTLSTIKNDFRVGKGGTTAPVAQRAGTDGRAQVGKMKLRKIKVTCEKGKKKAKQMHSMN